MYTRRKLMQTGKTNKETETIRIGFEPVTEKTTPMPKPKKMHKDSLECAANDIAKRILKIKVMRALYKVVKTDNILRGSPFNIKYGPSHAPTHHTHKK